MVQPCVLTNPLWLFLIRPIYPVVGLLVVHPCDDLNPSQVSGEFTNQP